MNAITWILDRHSYFEMSDIYIPWALRCTDGPTYAKQAVVWIWVLLKLLVILNTRLGPSFCEVLTPFPCKSNLMAIQISSIRWNMRWRETVQGRELILVLGWKPRCGCVCGCEMCKCVCLSVNFAYSLVLNVSDCSSMAGVPEYWLTMLLLHLTASAKRHAKQSTHFHTDIFSSWIPLRH